jgi:glyoxylase-like metal-dependent hydrolase (beta-lactamase superfamily II)
VPEKPLKYSWYFRFRQPELVLWYLGRYVERTTCPGGGCMPQNDQPFAATLLSRRELLKRGTALAAATSGCLIQRPAWAATTDVHTFKCGSFDVTVMSDGNLSFPISFALPDRDPKEVEAIFKTAGLPLDGITAQVNVSIVKTPDALILIDTGGGNDFLPSVGKLTDRLEAAGFSPESFTHVVFTHAHADHLWGAIDPFDGGTRFTNAKHFMSTVEFNYWGKPDREADVPDIFKMMAVGTGRRLKAIASRIEQRNPGDEIVSGVTLIDSAGHTPGHVSVLLASGNERLMVSGDAINHPLVSFAYPNWRWRADMDAQAGAATRNRLLDQLASGNIALLGYHLPWPGLGRVERTSDAYRFVQS